MTDWVISVIDGAGYLGLFGLMFLECVFPPIPSEAILPFVGFAVAQGDMNFVLALVAATSGALVGNIALYVAARRGGVALVRRHGHRFGAGPERLLTLERWMDRWGSATVLVGRAVPLARSAVSLPAGLGRFPFGRFLLLTTIGSAAWNTTLISIGWALDDSWRTVEERMGPASIVVVVLMVVAAVVIALVARRRRVRGRRTTQPS